MSCFREYKDRRAAAEGWPYYYMDGSVERVHHTKFREPACPVPVEPLETIADLKADLRMYKFPLIFQRHWK